MKNNPKLFPQPKYSHTSNENNYKCQGSSCSCKYEYNRTNYDNTQYKQYSFDNSQNISKEIKNMKIYNHKPYKQGYKYLGV
jgi:hypothetical protein